MTLPQQTAAWVLREQNGIDGLEFVQDVPISAVKEDEVLVKIYAASLNYRDVVIAKVICFRALIIRSLKRRLNCHRVHWDYHRAKEISFPDQTEPAPFKQLVLASQSLLLEIESART